MQSYGDDFVYHDAVVLAYAPVGPRFTWSILALLIPERHELSIYKRSRFDVAPTVMYSTQGHV